MMLAKMIYLDSAYAADPYSNNLQPTSVSAGELGALEKRIHPVCTLDSSGITATLREVSYAIYDGCKLDQFKEFVAAELECRG